MSEYQWGDFELRWGSAITSARSDRTLLLADPPIFLLTDPDTDSIAQTKLSGALIDGFSALSSALVASGRSPTVEQLRRVWSDAIHNVERELAARTILSADFPTEFEVPAVLLTPTTIDGRASWIIKTSGSAAVTRVRGEDISITTGDFAACEANDDERFVAMTSGLHKTLSSGRIKMILTQLRRAQRASAVLASQIPPSVKTSQAVLVIDCLSQQGAEALASPATIDVSRDAGETLMPSDEILEYLSGEESACPVQTDRLEGMTADLAIRKLGIENPDDDVAEGGGTHGRRSSTPPPVLDDFEFVSYLGSGGFADVYLYEERTPRRMVAIKVLKDRPDGEDAEMAFRAEIDLMGQLSGHPSIVAIHDANFAPSGQPYIVMQFCPLPSLAEQLVEGPIPIVDALRLGIHLAGGVHTAHVLGIVHHDLKPANVLTTEFGRAVLGDFGIASLVGASTIEVAGISLPWAAPEVLRAETAGTLADVYSLAATVYTAIFGKAPHAVDGKISRRDYIGRVLTEEIPYPALKSLDGPAMDKLREVLAGALERDREDRTQSAREFGEGLQDVQRIMNFSLTELDVPLAL